MFESPKGELRFETFKTKLKKPNQTDEPDTVEKNLDSDKPNKNFDVYGVICY